MPEIGRSNGDPIHAYYLLTRHTSPVTLPPGCVYVEAWASRPYIRRLGGPCFGVAEFDRQLTAKEMTVYGLTPYGRGNL